LPFPTLRGDLAYTGKLAGGYLLIQGVYVTLVS
jgi:hypothetical protein